MCEWHPRVNPAEYGPVLILCAESVTQFREYIESIGYTADVESMNTRLLQEWFYSEDLRKSGQVN